MTTVPAYDTDSDVAANAVVVTRVLNTEDVFGYSLSVLVDLAWRTASSSTSRSASSGTVGR